MADGLARALGREVRYHDTSPDDYRSLGFDGAEDLGNMFQVKRDFEEWYCGNRDPGLARRLNPELLDYDAWLARYADRIPLD